MSIPAEIYKLEQIEFHLRTNLETRDPHFFRWLTEHNNWGLMAMD